VEDCAKQGAVSIEGQTCVIGHVARLRSNGSLKSTS